MGLDQTAFWVDCHGEKRTICEWRNHYDLERLIAEARGEEGRGYFDAVPLSREIIERFARAHRSRKWSREVYRDRPDLRIADAYFLMRIEIYHKNIPVFYESC